MSLTLLSHSTVSVSKKISKCPNKQIKMTFRQKPVEYFFYLMEFWSFKLTKRAFNW